MRGGFRRRHHEDEEESAFVSMTDMTVSFLFILMILLAYSASRMSNETTVPKSSYDALSAERDRTTTKLLESQLAVVARDRRITELEEALKRKNPLEAYMSAVADQRRNVLETLRDRLKLDFPDLQVVISEELDALRFKGDGLFASGDSRLTDEKRRIVERIATRLNEVLPCYTLGTGATWNEKCNGVGAVIEAIQIEGHTDGTGNENSNISLSTNRANETFFAMKSREPGLIRRQNMRGQPVMSVAGYGAMRPIAGNDTSEGRSTNRRIDLRIIMYTPRNSDEIAGIRKSLQDSVRDLPAQ